MGAGSQGVLVVATGTVATLGKGNDLVGLRHRLSSCTQGPMHGLGCVVSRPASAVPGLVERKAMAVAFAQLPARVLWRLSDAEVPDDAALAELQLGNNTKVGSGSCGSWGTELPSGTTSLQTAGNITCIPNSTRQVYFYQCMGPSMLRLHKARLWKDTGQPTLHSGLLGHIGDEVDAPERRPGPSPYKGVPEPLRGQQPV